MDDVDQVDKKNPEDSAESAGKQTPFNPALAEEGATAQELAKETSGEAGEAAQAEVAPVGSAPAVRESEGEPRPAEGEAVANQSAAEQIDDLATTPEEDAEAVVLRAKRARLEQYGSPENLVHALLDRIEALEADLGKLKSQTRHWF